jgi:hypothetical protein
VFPQTEGGDPSGGGSVAANPIFTFGFFAEKMSHIPQLLSGGLQSFDLLAKLSLFGLFLAQYFVDIFHGVLLIELYGGGRAAVNGAAACQITAVIPRNSGREAG